MKQPAGKLPKKKTNTFEGYRVPLFKVTRPTLCSFNFLRERQRESRGIDRELSNLFFYHHQSSANPRLSGDT
jgi:hypothetical protein